jgi:Fungal Zn(2)-Cys(6) binuclear cluster domain
MRACEGCRRRKIKCDAATTNTWPCSACIRLKLHCVPPMMHYDRDFGQQNQNTEAERSPEFDRSSGSDDEYHHHTSILDQLAEEHKFDNDHLQQVSYDTGVGIYQSPPYTSQPHLQHHTIPLQYSSISPPGLTIPDVQYPPTTMFPTPSPQAPSLNDPNEIWQTEQYGSSSLSEALGQLAIDETGIGTVP